MSKLGFRVWGLGFWVFILNASIFASITPGGYYGYSYTPTPKSIEQGELGYAARFDFIGDNDIHHSILMRPLLFMELGIGISKHPSPAAKFILPFYEDGQGMALGFSGKRWYFTGMLNWLTIAGIYDINLHTPVGSVAGEADFGYVAFNIENFWYLNKYGAATAFTLRPLLAFDIPSYLEANAGVSWRSPEHKEDFFAYVAVQAKAPLLKTEKEPIAYLDINPAFDHSVSFARNNYQLRAVFDIDAALVAPFNVFLVGSLSPSLKTENQNRLLKRDMLDRYYLLWSREKVPIWAACGMLNSAIYGCQANTAKDFYNAFAITFGYTRGEQTGINAIGQLPLHPKFSGFFSNSLLFAEGGMFLGERLAAQLNFRQGTEKKHLQVGSGYDFDRKSIYGELSLQYDFSISTQISGMAIRLAPNARHRESSDFYVYDYDVPIYQEGNSGVQLGKRLHNFPWKK
jgi:hypothetical protein